MEYFDGLILMMASTFRLSVPLIFCALAGLYTERAGVFDIGLEGKMLVGAFAAGVAAAYFGNPYMGLLAGILASVVFSLIHGYASVTQRGNQIVSGVAINFITSGLTTLVGQAWYSQGGRTPQLEEYERFGSIILPFADQIRPIPILGPIYADLISGQSLMAYLAFAAVPFTWWVVYRTRFGLRLRAVGENPAAVDTAGISVTFLRYRAVIICGIFAGFAGTYLSISQSAGFGKDMTAGRGYMALAALIFAKWKPVPVLFACLLFGFLDAMGIRLQGSRIPYLDMDVPVQIFQALPYLLTVVLLAGFIGAAVPPKAGGVPYTKER